MPPKTPHRTARLRQLAAQHGIILLYHAVTEAAWPRVHCVTPAQLQTHIAELGEYFRWVSLAELIAAPDKSGLGALTFDDGYANVLATLPRRPAIPCTLFINPMTLRGEWNWRDWVRVLIAHKLEAEFAEFYPLPPHPRGFYRASKQPQHNSRAVAQALARFFASDHVPDRVATPMQIYGKYPYLRQADLQPVPPLVQYGNHSMHHYVLSSLSPTEQYEEIHGGHTALTRALKKTPTAILPACFSAPFGGTADLNPTTQTLLTQLHYRTLLMSRQQLQPATAQMRDGVQILERFMPRGDDVVGELVGM